MRQDQGKQRQNKVDQIVSRSDMPVRGRGQIFDERTVVLGKSGTDTLRVLEELVGAVVNTGALYRSKRNKQTRALDEQGKVHHGKGRQDWTGGNVSAYLLASENL